MLSGSPSASCHHWLHRARDAASPALQLRLQQADAAGPGELSPYAAAVLETEAAVAAMPLAGRRRALAETLGEEVSSLAWAGLLDVQRRLGPAVSTCTSAVQYWWPRHSGP